MLKIWKVLINIDVLDIPQMHTFVNSSKQFCFSFSFFNSIMLERQKLHYYLGSIQIKAEQTMQLIIMSKVLINVTKLVFLE